MTPVTSPATVRAPTGNSLSCKGWHQEAALRMLMNNLDPGGGRAARGADRLWRERQGGAQLGVLSSKIVATLRRLENDETLLVQSGKPVGVFRTHEEAPRVLIANAHLVPAGRPGTSSAGSRRSGSRCTAR